MSTEKDQKDEKCPICFDEPLNAKLWCCGNKIGAKCFITIAVKNHKQCPLCRGESLKCATKEFKKVYGENEAVVKWSSGFNPEGVQSISIPISAVMTVKEISTIIREKFCLDEALKFKLYLGDRFMSEMDKTLGDYHYLAGSINIKLYPVYYE